MNWFKKVNAIDLITQNLNFNRLTKMNFNARMEEA